MSLPSRRRHWMNTRLRTKLRAGGSQPNYQQFDYSTLDPDDEPSGAMLPVPTYPQDLDQPILPPDLPVESRPSDPKSDVSFNECLPQLISDHELARSPSPQLSPSDNPPEQSLVGTSSPLLTHQSLTDYLSNYPIWPNQAEGSNMSLSCSSSPSVDDTAVVTPQNPTALPSTRRSGGPRKQTRVSRQRKIPARDARGDVTSATTEKQAVSQALRYQLRQNRQPRYNCGTCGLRDCICIIAVNENWEVPIGARGVPPRKDHRTSTYFTALLYERKDLRWCRKNWQPPR